MAFTLNTLSRQSAGANSDAPTFWAYSTTDTIADVNTADYFLAAIDRIKAGDVIFVYSSTGGTPVMTITYCNANDGTTIDVVDGLTVTATDTD